jgi:thioredoxin 1
VQFDAITTLNAAAFDAMVVQANGPVAVEFMSYGCAYCRALEPVLQRAAEAVKAREKIFRVNIAVEPGLAESYDIHGTPTLVLFRDGSETGRIEGPPPVLADILAYVTQPLQA